MGVPDWSESIAVLRLDSDKDLVAAGLVDLLWAQVASYHYSNQFN